MILVLKQKTLDIKQNITKNSFSYKIRVIIINPCKYKVTKYYYKLRRHLVFIRVDLPIFYLKIFVKN